MANIYKNFSPEDIITVKKKVTKGVFTGFSPTLTQLFTGSQASETGSTGRGLYYLDVFNTGSSLPNASVQFSVSYGHKDGYGTPTVTTDSGSRRPTQAVYRQYANTLLPLSQNQFTFYSGSTANSHTSNDVFVINFSRTRIKEELDTDSFEIHLSGSNGIFKFIDDSADITNPAITPGGVVYDIASGSIDLTTTGSDIITYTASNGEGYGKFYPESGIIILNPSAIGDTVGTVNGVYITGSAANTSAATYDNLHYTFYESMTGGSYIKARSAEDVSSQSYFVRVRNREFNFSNNPTYVSGSDKQIIDSLYNEPITYISTVGLYNENNELLAVAKTSRPVINGRDTESLIKIKIDF
jgi:hypothetical protein